MYNRRRARILLAVLVLSALILVTVDFRSDGREGEGPLGQLRAGASVVFGPIQNGLSTIMRPVANSLGNVRGLFDARSENVQLRAQLERLQERRLSYEDVLRENEQLRQLLDIQQRSTLDTVAAQVIASGPSNFEWTITLDVGTNDGVQRNMPVITGDGLVGRIIQTTSNTSRVLLAVDPSFQVAAGHARTGEIGTLQGNGGDPMIFRPLNPEAQVSVGDGIVTSLYSGGVFPAGIPIGTVESDEATGFLTRSIQVRPWVNFTRLQTVLVVLYDARFDLPGDDFGDVVWRRPDVPARAPDDQPTATEDPFDPFHRDPTEEATEEPTGATGGDG